MSTTRKSLPAAGRAFVGAVGLAGLGVVIASLAANSAPIPREWIAFSILTLLTGNTLTFKVPSVPHLRLSLSEVFTFSCLMLYGPELATITATIEGLLHALRWRNSLIHTCFNLGNLSLSVWISGTLFFLVAGVSPLADGPAQYGELILPLTVLAASFYGLNSGLTATVISFEARRPPLTVWREHFAFLAPTYAAGGSIAFLLVMALRQLDFSAIVLIPPVLLIRYPTMRSSFGRLEDSKAHVEKLNRHVPVDSRDTGDGDRREGPGHPRPHPPGAGRGARLAREIGIKDETSSRRSRRPRSCTTSASSRCPTTF